MIVAEFRILLTASPGFGYPCFMQPSLFSTVQWTVTALTRHIRDLLESDAELQELWVEGEISNVSRPASGHVYFTLKDAGASLRCVMWREAARRWKDALQDGLALAVHGKIGVYETSGQYQLYADQIRPVGEGALYQEFLRLKGVLEAEGLFQAERKRPIPEFPRRIGIVTSASGAALRDMLTAIRRRMPLVEVILCPSPVQGDEAPAGLVEALAALNRIKPEPDVILLARGGGSIEDLWAFNDERVVRAVAASRVPVICGVGHETDFTLSDFAADLRAPTPTAAAELATPRTVPDLLSEIQALDTTLSTFTLNQIEARQATLSTLTDHLRFFTPVRRIQTDRQKLDDLARRAGSGMQYRLALEARQLEGSSKRLESLNPDQVLARGYAVVTRQRDDSLVHQVGQVKPDERIGVRVSDGRFEATVTGDHKK